jgi:thimet oligopeptidase
MNGTDSSPSEPVVSTSDAVELGSLGRLPWTLSTEELRTTATEVVRDANERLDALVRTAEPPTLASLLRPLDRILLGVRDLGNHGSFLFAVHPDAATRTAAREASEAADRFFNGFRVDERVYRALRALDLGVVDPTTKFAVERMLREMRRSGVGKDAERRAELLALNNLIDRICNQYNENIARLDRSIDVDGAPALSGLPSDFLLTHPVDGAGKIRLSTKYPDFHPVMAYADNAEVRRRLLAAFLNRAYPENMGVLDQLLHERYSLARSLDYATYAAFALEDKMIGTPEAARVFLERVASRVREPALRDQARVLQRKRRDEPTSARLELWDASFFGEGYYDGKLRTEEYGVDTKRLRAYLPYGQVRDGLFQLCEELFGIHIRRAEVPSLWHPTVEAYDVTQNGEPLGRFYLDLVPRDGKYNHAACFSVREGIRGVQLPQAALVCNFLDPTQPSATARMQYADVVTFFHEFGHLLHALFSGHGPWVYTGGSFVEWDFIEAPSQLFEEWARDPATLARFARDPDTGETIPAEVLARLKGAEAFGRGSRWLRQVALASISLEYYDRDPTGLNTTELLRETYHRYFPNPLEPEYHLEAAWGHLTGYSAFYYTYVWSLVIARDLLQPFLDKGSLTDPEIAARYAREILAPGGQRPAADLVRAYLGREFNFEAFETWLRAETVPPPAP